MGLLIGSITSADPGFYRKKKQLENSRGGGSMSNQEFIDNTTTLSDSGTSVFDPVLCELSYAWYTKEGDKIIDPFAGGSVRGIVAEKMGRSYTGVELRREQVEANIEQANDIGVNPNWIIGDSSNLDVLVPDNDFDFAFTCPPYADLEVYSDDPADLSNMPWDKFLEFYEVILRKTVEKLSDNRFAVVVIGDVRDKKGFYRNLPGHTIEIMERAGARYYNEAILVTQVGSLSIRVSKQFTASRKLGKTHQNVLTFCKGDPKRATERLGDVYIEEFESD